MSRTPRPTATLLSLLLLVGLILGACSGSSPAGAPTSASPRPTRTPTPDTTIRVRLTHAGNAQSNFGKAALRFKDLAEARTQGQVQVDLFPDLMPALGDDQAALEALALGGVEATIQSNLAYTHLEPRMEALSLPFIMASRQNAYSVVDGDVGQELLHSLEKRGIVGLGYGEAGFRQITNSVRPILRPEDMKGLKVGVPKYKLYQDTMTALGAQPMAITFTNLWGALDRKEVDAQDNPLPLIYSAKLYDVQPYLTVWDYSWDTAILGFNRGSWDKLSPNTRAALRDAGRAAMDYMRQLAQQDDRTLMVELQSLGVSVTVFTATQKQAFFAAVKPVYQSQDAAVGPDFIERVRRIGQAR